MLYMQNAGKGAAKQIKKKKQTRKFSEQKKMGMKTGTQEIPHMFRYAGRIKKKTKKMCESKC